MLNWTQAQYIFIHEVIKHKLQLLGYGVTSPADDNANDDDNLYESKTSKFC